MFHPVLRGVVPNTETERQHMCVGLDCPGMGLQGDTYEDVTCPQHLRSMGLSSRAHPTLHGVGLL